MFGIRPDGKRVKNIDPIVRMTAHIMPKRYDAQVMMERSIDYEPIKNYLKKKREEGINLTHMDVFIAAYLRLIKKRPELNRFVVNRTLYQRNELTVSMAILKNKDADGAINETVIKVRFNPDDTIFDVSKKLNEAISANKSAHEKGFVDKLASFFVSLPLVSGAIIELLKFLDRFGLLHKFFLDSLPFHTSLFITNMASIKMGAVYHHIYDFGTTSVFLSLGQRESRLELDKENNVVKKHYIPIGAVIDERICSGAVYAMSFNYFNRLLKNPSVLENS